MNLRHIQTTACPRCNTEIVVAETLDHDVDRGEVWTHSCGQHRETRRFVCGFGVQWSPNFNREEFQGECHREPAYAEKLKRRGEAKEQLADVISGLDVDDVFKDWLRRSIP